MMSGGSYNYLYRKLEDWDWAGANEELGNMEKRLRQTGYILAADKIAKFLEVYDMYDKILLLRADGLSELAHAVEWTDSSDWDEDQLEQWCIDNNLAKSGIDDKQGLFATTIVSNEQ